MSNPVFPHSARFPYPRMVLLILIVGLACSASALDLTLNGRNHAILDSDDLDAFSRAGVIPLQALFPWLESIDYLEVQSGVNQVYWEAARLGDGQWNSALLVKTDGVWEIRVGRDVFSSPDRIAVKGVPLGIDSISIWSALDNPGIQKKIKTDLLSAFALRSVTVHWREMTRPEYFLSDPPGEGLPHLILLDHLDAIRLESLLTSSRPVAFTASVWRVAADNSAADTPLALDAYHPEAALLYLLAENPELFDEEGLLPPGLGGLFTWAAASRKSDLVVTDRPMSALAAGTAAAAVRLPSSDEPRNPGETELPPVSPPENAVNIARYSFASIPAGLSEAEGVAAGLALADAGRIAGNIRTGEAVPLPMNPQLIRFFDAYERIGRLAVSGQMDPARAVELMNDFITGAAE